MKGDAEKYCAAGMSDYVSKPIEREKLNAAIQRQCGTRLELQELLAAPVLRSRKSLRPTFRTSSTNSSQIWMAILPDR